MIKLISKLPLSGESILCILKVYWIKCVETYLFEMTGVFELWQTSRDVHKKLPREELLETFYSCLDCQFSWIHFFKNCTFLVSLVISQIQRATAWIFDTRSVRKQNHGLKRVILSFQKVSHIHTGHSNLPWLLFS